MAALGLILLAASLVVGITMSVVDTSAANQLPSNRRNEFAQSAAIVGDTAGHTDSATPSAFAPPSAAGRPPCGERYGPGNQSLASRLAFGLFGLFKNSVIIGVVVLAVVWLSWVFTPHSITTSPN